MARRGVDQLGGNANIVASLANAAFDQELCAEFAAGAYDVDVASTITERVVPQDHLQLTKL